MRQNLDSRSLNRLVTIKRLAGGQDSIGQPLQEWVVQADRVWANIKHMAGAESIRAGQDVSLLRSSIRIRKRTDVSSAMRVYCGATVYEIKAVLPDEEGQGRIDLVCEVVNG